MGGLFGSPFFLAGCLRPAHFDHRKRPMTTNSPSPAKEPLTAILRRNALSYCIMLGHVCVDGCQGGISAVLPFVVALRGYSYTDVAVLIFAANVVSAVIQPLFGWLGDKRPMPWIMSLGVLLAGLGMAGIGLVPEFWQIVLCAMISGVGNAMMHPEGGRLANLTASKSKAGGMSIFSVGGQVGFCVGPIIAAASCAAFGLAGTLAFLIICLPVSVLLGVLCPVFSRYGCAGVKGTQDLKREYWGRFSLVMGALSARSIIYYAVTGFAPLFMMGVFGHSESSAGLLVSAFGMFGALATVISASVSQRVGTTRLTVLCYAGCAVCLAAFALSPSPWLCVGLIVALAFAISLYNAPAVALGQSMIPNHLGTASGLTFGVAVCIGGVTSPALGAIGDAAGLRVVMLVVAGVAAVGLAFGWAVHRLEQRAPRV